MKIVRLYAENFKKLSCVEVLPDGNVVPIKGKNGNGKTSVLDAIWAALQWKSASKEIKSPINRNADKAEISLDLGDYFVKRTFSYNEDGEKVTSRLTITKPNGDRVTKPQAILDGLIGEISFDPMEFSRMKDADKRRAIADLAGIDLTQIDSERREAEAERRDIKREVSRLKSILQGIQPPTDDDPDEEEDPSEILDKLQKVSEHQLSLTKLSSDIDRLEENIKEMIAARDILKKQKAELEAKTPQESHKDLKERLDNINQRNNRAREVKEYNKLKDSLSKLEKDVEKLTAKVELSKINLEEAVESADLNVPGISIDYEGIKINGIHWDELSDGEKIRYSMSIAMTTNPKLRVIRIKDGSLLDSENLGVLQDLAGQNDFQVWVETVANSPDGVGVFLENGHVKD